MLIIKDSKPQCYINKNTPHQYTAATSRFGGTFKINNIFYHQYAQALPVAYVESKVWNSFSNLIGGIMYDAAFGKKTEHNNTPIQISTAIKAASNLKNQKNYADKGRVDFQSCAERLVRPKHVEAKPNDLIDKNNCKTVSYKRLNQNDIQVLADFTYQLFDMVAKQGSRKEKQMLGGFIKDGHVDYKNKLSFLGFGKELTQLFKNSDKTIAPLTVVHRKFDEASVA